MLPIAYYLLKVIICSGILYGYYWLSLRNKVFHKYNRFYLMAAILLSMLLPLIKIDFWQQQAQQQSGVIRVLQAVSSGDEYMDNIIVTTGSNSFDMEQLYPFAYMLVSLILLVVFFHTLFVIFSLLRKYPKQTIDNVSFINTDAKSTPFSFLNYIFWNYNIDVETTTGNQIFKHELAHVQEGHTYDKLFINIVLIFFWCNPFYWLYRKELNMIHEFIADKKAVEDNDTEAFAAMILQATYPQHRFQLTNNFFYSPIKRRLLMLTKNKNPKVNYFGRIMVLPLLVLIFAAFTFKAKPISHYYLGKKLTVVIDAGHGGTDGGIKAADGTLEKEITLAIAKKIKELNSNDAIEIILTKEEDKFLSKEQKAEFTKEHNAAIFITLHTGATVTTAQKEYGPGGGEMGNQRGLKLVISNNNFPFTEQSKLFGSIMLSEFSDHYGLPVLQQLLQRHLYTLENTPCPSVFIETGLLSDKKDFDYLVSGRGQENIAKNILTAIEKFASIPQENNVPVSAALPTGSITTAGMFVNVKNTDTNYFKSNAYKTQALVIIDEKEIGNFGLNYIEKNKFNYSSIVIYGPMQAQKTYGTKGRYGVIKLTVNDAVCLTADSIFYDDKKQTIKLSGTNSSIKGNLEKTLIYVDGKEITPLQLNEIKPEKISSINILKGEKLDAIVEEKGKTAIINVTLKPAALEEVIVQGKKIEPLYVIDNEIQTNNIKVNTVTGDHIKEVNVLKGVAATDKYGDKGKNGVVEITTKNQLIANTIAADGSTSKAVIALDKINVLYIGVDNHLSVAAPNVDSKDLQLTISQGSISGSNGRYIARVYSSEDATITVSKKGDDKALETFIYRVKRIPDPVNAVGELVLTGYASKKYADTLTGIQIDRIFTKVENEPYYPGGSEAWKKYLMKNLDPTIPLKEGWKAGTYTVIVQFIVHADGTVSDVTTTNYQGSKTAQHCVDLIKKTANWSPAIQNGRTVNAYRKQPITFVIEADKKDITEIYSAPFRVHLMIKGKMSTYHMVSNGKFTAKFKELFYINGKLSSDPRNIKPGTITAIESYDEGAGKLGFGDKGKYGVTLTTTKS